MDLDTLTPPPPDRVGRLALAGAKWSVSLLILRQMVSVVTMVVLSRILPAGDFGIVAMVGSLTSFLMLISDMGLSWATVQAERLEEEQVNTLFWIAASLGAMAWTVCALGARQLAQFYNAEDVAPLCVLLGAGVFVNALSIQPTALLKRQMRQKHITISQTASVVVGGLIAITLALAGARFWALAAQSVGTSAALLVTSLYWSRYRPAFPSFSARAIPLLTFGGYIAACNTVTYLQLTMDNVLIGRYCGADQLGYYSRAYFLRTLPALYASIAVTDVMVPALTALASDRQRLGAAYRKAIRMIAFVGCPIAALVTVGAPEIVIALYGHAWAPVVPLLYWLALPALVLPVSTSVGWLFIAVGKGRQMFLLSLLTTPIVLIGYWIGISWGALGIAIAGAALFTIPLPWLSLHCAHRAANISLRQTLHSVLPILLASVGMAVAAFAAGTLVAWEGGPWPAIFAAKLFVGVVTYACLTTYLVQPLPIDWLKTLLSTWPRPFSEHRASM